MLIFTRRQLRCFISVITSLDAGDLLMNDELMFVIVYVDVRCNDKVFIKILNDDLHVWRLAVRIRTHLNDHAQVSDVHPLSLDDLHDDPVQISQLWVRRHASAYKW